MIRNTKIAIAISDITKCGGTERTVIALANYLSQNVKHVEIISLFSKSDTNTFFSLNEKIEISHLSILSYTGKSPARKLCGWITSLIKCYKGIRCSDSDILIGTSRNTNILLLLYKRGRKVIGCEHFASSVPMNSMLKKMRNISYRKLEKLIVLTERDVFYYSCLNINVKLIPNATPFEMPRYCEKENVAIAVGRHTEEKAFDKLIKLWKKVEDYTSVWTLYIIGEGELLEYNKQIALENNCRRIKFLPFQKNIIESYKKASLYLMTSLYEALPMVLIEAKTCGCVCVSYDCDTGPREIIVNDEDGFIIPVDDENMFVKRILQLIDDKKLLNIMSKKAVANSKEYSAEYIMPKWLALIDELC